MSDNNNSHGHEKVEKNVGLMAVLIAVVVSFGGLLIVAGMFLMAWHMWKTRQMARDPAPIPVMSPDNAEARA